MTDEMRNMLDAFGLEIKGDLDASDEEITKALSNAIKTNYFRCTDYTSDIEEFTIKQLEELIEQLDKYQYEYQYTTNDLIGFIRVIT